MRLLPVSKGNYRRLLFLLGVMSVLGSYEAQTATIARFPYNFLVIMTDDQRWDTLWAMPVVQEKLITQGVNFTQAFVPTPLCCPARASFLGGGYYAHNTGVLTNTEPNGGAEKFLDTNTLPFHLQRHGYTTGYFGGKYLNHYKPPYIPPAYIPPGWSRFIVRINKSYTDFRVVIGSSDAYPSTGSVERKSQYITDYLRDEALSFLEEVGDCPFFLFFTPNAPHSPATPASEDEGLFSSYVYRGRGYGETDRSDKPENVRNKKPYDAAKGDEFHRDQLRSLQAVDRAVGALVDKLQELGKLDNTVIVYTSDNGYQWGEHGLTGKGFPFEESIRVPLIVVAPGILPREDESLVVSNLDIPTMVWNLAGLSKDTDGLDLLLLLQNPRMSWRSDGIFIEFFDSGPERRPEIWAGWRTRNYKYVEHTDGQKELYDLVTDPYELQNIAADLNYQHIIRRLSERTVLFKGLAITVEDVPEGKVGENYVFQMTAWGGTPPYKWTVHKGTLPEGLTLDRHSGIIQGIPRRSQKDRILIKVQDSSVATQTNRPQTFIREFRFEIIE